ncbi:hypothetical protein KXD93_22245 [Mucilaginibacter sp. BJC16-A38]|uniref:hypothetical protein n=1 Tax=Mucilaginibacter phenanthrenivorans TaxID=1234842 RepID=UPI00215742A2|nr:hypothetical protein [Mucilaginibacter phenanthrenivorans]MCR8560391.1 hypothetical protein [Mucilaginibacter phenanthrenivorans]
MAKYKISGVWKDDKGVITHYGMHAVNTTGISRVTKTNKAEAVRILSIPTNEGVTWIWDYSNTSWKEGAKVEVISGQFLRTIHDGKIIDNLAHLINYNWVVA